MRTLQTISTSFLTRHSHSEAYAALVVAGHYEEAGDLGRFHVEAGDVLLHDHFGAHLNRFPGSGAVVLNLPLPIGHSFTPGVAKVSDPDLIVKEAERSRADAASLLLPLIRQKTLRDADWPEELAADLIQDSSLSLSQWAAERGLAPWTVSRGFSQVFGITPEGFRARARGRRALKMIQSTGEPLIHIAFLLGFADQAHMTRSVKQITGLPPHAWRCSCK